MDIKRGKIYYADLEPVIGSEQGGIRPVVILQNDIGNCFSNTIITAPMTSKVKRESLPTHVIVDIEQHGCVTPNMIMLEQIRTIDKQRLKHYVATLEDTQMNEVDKAILISMGIKEELK